MCIKDVYGILLIGVLIKKRKGGFRMNVCNVCNRTMAPKEEAHKDCSVVIRIKGVSEEIILFLKREEIFLPKTVRRYRYIKRGLSFPKIYKAGVAFYQHLVSVYKRGAFATATVTVVKNFIALLAKLAEFLRKKGVFQGEVCLSH